MGNWEVLMSIILQNTIQNNKKTEWELLALTG